MVFEISLNELFLVCNALLLAVALLVIIRFRREAKAMLSFWQSPVGNSLADVREAREAEHPGSGQRQSLLESVTRLEQQMLFLRRELKRNANDELPNGLDVAPSRSLPLENAVRMARHGASEEELARNCGLSTGEARLMRKLHGKAQRTH